MVVQVCTTNTQAKAGGAFLEARTGSQSEQHIGSPSTPHTTNAKERNSTGMVKELLELNLTVTKVHGHMI